MEIEVGKNVINTILVLENVTDIQTADIRTTDIQTYRPSDEAGPIRGAFAPKKTRCTYIAVSKFFTVTPSTVHNSTQ